MLSNGWKEELAQWRNWNLFWEVELWKGWWGKGFLEGQWCHLHYMYRGWFVELDLQETEGKDEPRVRSYEEIRIEAEKFAC